MRFVRRRFRESDLLATLRLPRPCDLETLQAEIERRRGTRILLVPMESATGAACGLWVRRGDEDLVFVDSGTSAVHRRHIVLHEFGHMLLGHTGTLALSLLLPHLDPAAVQYVLGRRELDRQEERDAERLAMALARLVAGPEGLDPEPVPAPQPVDPREQRLVAALEQ